MFPKREDKLTLLDIFSFMYRSDVFNSFLNHYDLVQAYASDPIFPLLANKHPYIAFEHGTIRELPFENSAIGRLTALAYRKADLVFITNSDNFLAAKKLGLKNFVPIPHPLDNYWHLKYRNLKRNPKEKILFCPVRHDWREKGIDLYLEALPEIIKKTNFPIKFLLVRWGIDLKKSKDLINQLGIEKYIEWIRPLPRQKFAYWLAKADIVLDQLILPAMGGIAPEGMQAGKPVLMSYRHETGKWMFPEKPPIVEVHTKKEITDSILKLLNNPRMAREIGKMGQIWFNKYHSKQRVKEILISNYRKLLKNYH